MALPKLDIPTYEINLISTGKPIRFRPFLVKEQKLFLMASESEDPKEVIRTIRQVLRNCILDEIDVDSLPTFDLEYVFMNLRARSVDEFVELKYKCNNFVKTDTGEENRCTGTVDIKINLLEIEPTKNPDHKKDIKITDKIGVSLRYPTFDMMQKYESLPEDDLMLQILVDCIEFIYDENQIYYAKDSTRKELEDFIDSLQQKDLEKFRDFFETLPEVKKDIHFKCGKCGYEEDIIVKGIQNFFV